MAGHSGGGREALRGASRRWLLSLERILIMFEVQAEPMGSIQTTKKGCYIRKFLCVTAGGKKGVFSVYSKAADRLSGDAVRKLLIEPQDLVFLVEWWNIRQS